MLDRTAISAIDGLLWLQNGEETAGLLHLSASSVSRKANGCAAALGLVLQHHSGRWQLYGRSDLLKMERHLLQDYRLAGYGPLRLDCCFETLPLLAERAGGGKPWGVVVPRQAQRHPQAAYGLLEERVIDAYVGAVAPDLPDGDGPLAAMPLLELPLQVLAALDHPLQGRNGVGLVERLAYPSPATSPCWALPRRERHLQGQGLSRDPLPSGREVCAHLRDQVLGSAGLMVATSLATTALQGLGPLAVDLALNSAVVLVIRRELEEHPRIRDLAVQLRGMYGDQLRRMSEGPARA